MEPYANDIKCGYIFCFHTVGWLLQKCRMLDMLKYYILPLLENETSILFCM